MSQNYPLLIKKSKKKKKNQLKKKKKTNYNLSPTLFMIHTKCESKRKSEYLKKKFFKRPLIHNTIVFYIIMSRVQI